MTSKRATEKFVKKQNANSENELYKETGLTKVSRLSSVIDTRADNVRTTSGLSNMENQRKAFAAKKASARSAKVASIGNKEKLAGSLKDAEIEANHASHGITGIRSSANKLFGRLGKAIL